MNIGIDVDGVILNTEELLSIYAEIYDIETFKKDNLTNPFEYYQEKKYSWDEAHCKEFLSTSILNATWNSSFLTGAILIIKKLKELGHKLIIISARGTDYPEVLDFLEKRFKENDLIFDKLYWKTKDKLSVCKAENIDIMIDDRTKTCLTLSENNIHAFYFKNESRIKLEDNEYLTTVKNWGEIYKKIILLDQNKK